MLNQKALSQVLQKDDAVQRFQLNVTNVLNPVLATPIIDGRLLTGLVIPANGKLVVPHQLGRRVQGYVVVASNASYALPYAVAADQLTPTSSVVLTFSSGSGATISVWVF